jgi:hypothetical protein
MGAKLNSWGGGKFVETKEFSLVGGNSLKVETTNLFQGGLLDLGKPVDLAGAFSGKENLLTLSVYNMSLSGGGGGGPAGGGGGDPVGGGGGGRGGSVGLSGGGGEGGGGTTSSQPAKLANIRLVIRTSDGKLSEAMLPISSTGKWVKTGIPVSRIPGFAKTNKSISSVAVSGDAPAVFYIGEIGVYTDPTPIQGYLTNTDQNIGLGTELVLSGSAESGITPVEYVWDLDDRDGVQEDAIGQAIRHKFRVAGQFRVTLTIRDIYGLKKPWSSSFAVTVNP